MILFNDITIIDETGNITEHGYVGVEASAISYIGTDKPTGKFERVVDGRGRLLAPGFYNAHAHSAMTLLRGYGEGLKLDDWLNKRIFPFEAQMSAVDVYRGTLLALAESFRYGIVSSSDMYSFCEDVVRAAAESGAKMNVSRAVLLFDENADPYSDARYLEAKSLYEQSNGAEDGRILIDMSLHAEYTSTPALVRAIGELARDKNAHMHVHVSETKEEHEGCKERRDGRTPVRYLSDLGLFDTPTTAAHCVWVEEADIEIMREKGVTVATCPVSNLKLASGICDVPALFRAGVNVAIGTDSVSSNNSLNLIEEMKFFALVNKERQSDPTLVTPAQAIYAATRAGAMSQGRDDCGLLKQGCKADLIMIDVSGPNMSPVHDMLNNLVYSATGGDVSMTMIDGRIVYENGEYNTIDIEKVKAEVNTSVNRILSDL